MTFVVTHRGSGFPMLHRHPMRRAGRQLTNKLRGWRIPTPQERANRYVSRMPIAVVTASPPGIRQRADEPPVTDLTACWCLAAGADDAVPCRWDAH